MREGAPAPPVPRDPFALAALLLATDPAGLGGAVLRGPGGPAPRQWLDLLRALLPPGTPSRRIPPGITPDRLLGGIDLATTLASGERVLQPGVLAETDGGILVVPSAERMAPETVPPLLEALDRGRVRVERDGFSSHPAARLATVLLDEAEEEEGGVPAALLDRVAFLLPLPPRWGQGPGPLRLDPPEASPAPPETPSPGAEGGSVGHWEAGHLPRVRESLAGVEVPEPVIREVTEWAREGGLPSLRPVLLALRAARALAALQGRLEVNREDGLLAALLVLSPRGAPVPLPSPGDPPSREEAQGPEDGRGTARGSEDRAPGDPESGDGESEAPDAPPPESVHPTASPPQTPEAEVRGERRMELLVEAARALLPSGPDDALSSRGRPVRARGGGRGGTTLTRAHERGRRVGAEAGAPRRGRRLDLAATLRAAAPWQGIRSRGQEGEAPPGRRVQVRREDLHVQRRVRPALRRTLLLVDASGSQALRRLGEVKGAVELLLAGSYRRREEVALVVFRNREAELVLPPTRSLTRARRLLRGLPGGGGTPLPRALALALRLSAEARREGVASELALLTDGRPNVDLEGRGDRRRAREESLALASALGAARSPLRILDTSLRGEPFLEELASRSGGRVDRLPFADARRLSAALSRPDGRETP